MRLLLDTCMWGGTVKALVAAGHDVDHAGNWEETLAMKQSFAPLTRLRES